MSAEQDLMDNEHIKFWNDRHAASDPWRAGGHKGYSELRNIAFCKVRLGAVLQVLDFHFDTTECLKILDAGCGRGFFADELSRLGNDVMGIDASQVAIDYCKTNRAGGFEHSPLSDYKSIKMFDVIYSLDVLYHIVDDELWEKSFTNLQQQIRSGGLFIVSDTYAENRHICGDYIVFRTSKDYRRLASECDLLLLEHVQFTFMGSRQGMYVFRKP